ncbi:hypothetical protein R1sor_016665 [Riccia sorocarpa]|uniref:Replitron HUH endonuclease domain-containing protein n=1 Tax=Riccia sorocarpa TaxID=122646 RepID=A0ABD3HJU3_9MARC
MEGVRYHRSRGITYYLPSPWPETFSLTQISALQYWCKEFSHSSVAQYIGRIGILPRWWTEDHQDWYLDILQFVCIRTVKRGDETVLGPFNVVRTEGAFVLLEDERQQQFFFPKYLQRYEFGRKFYSCTGIWLYTSGCYCKRFLEAKHRVSVAMEFPQKRMKTLAREHAQTTIMAETSTQRQASRQPSTIQQTSSQPPKLQRRNGEDSTRKQAAAKPAEPKVRKPRHVPDKTFDVSITIGIPGNDIQGECFDRMVNFLERRAEMGVLGLERGDSHLQLHIQGMLRITTSSARALKTEIHNVIGWEQATPLGASICVKTLKYKGLHTVIGLIGYCLKDEGQEHFRFYTKNVTDEQKEEGRRMHAIYGASEYKNRLELNPANVLCRALQYRKYRVKNPTSITFRRCVREMFYSGQYMPSFRWLTSAKISSLRAERIWRVCTTPQAVEMPDVDHILYGIETTARYFEPPIAVKAESDHSDLPTEADDEALPAVHEDAPIPVINLEPKEGCGADLDRVQEALLAAGFAVERKTNKEMETSRLLPDYIRLWR